VGGGERGGRAPGEFGESQTIVYSPGEAEKVGGVDEVECTNMTASIGGRRRLYGGG